MLQADHSVSFVFLHQGCGLSLRQKIAEIEAIGFAPGDLTFTYDFTGAAERLANATSIEDGAIGLEILQRLRFFISPSLLPITVAPLLIQSLWRGDNPRSVILAYEGIPAERLAVAKQMLQAGSEAVLLRNDNQESLVIALALNTRNQRLVQHWANCVQQFCNPHQQHGDLEASLGSSLAVYLCDNVTTLRGLGHLTSAREADENSALTSHNRDLLRTAVRKALPLLKALQLNSMGSFVEALNLPSEDVEQQPGVPITNLMRLIWGEREDLQNTFDLTGPEGRQRFIEWFLARAQIEFELGDEFIAPIKQMGNSGVVSSKLHSPLLISRLTRTNLWRGFNLIGYPRAEMGMGEQLRSCADSLAAVNVPFGINDFSAGIIASHADRRFEELCQAGNPYPVNLFHINADQLPLARERLGLPFLRDHYNIGYWEWELSNFPEAWLTSIDMVDEIWAPSKFIHEAISARTQKPVIWMPLAIEFQAPAAQPSIREARASFGLPEGSYLFLFSFDFSSFSTRKNYHACLEAFRTAFPERENRSDVGLVLKTIRHPHHKQEFWEMLREVGDDTRIHVIDTVLRKPAMRSLIDVCDCFISLHRSEGFGLSIAEAMYLSKPVIATNYSGNVDFTHRDNAYLVDYQLVPVKSGEYVHPEGQVWADPDVDQAAKYMRRLADDPDEGVKVGRAASAFLRREHNFKVVGKRYAERLNQILSARNALAPPSISGEGRADRFNGIQRVGQMMKRLF